jgi:type III secretion protein J
VMEPGKKPTWSIEVDDDQAPDAVRLLSELGLPRAHTEGFGEVFGKGSLVPTPTEERALYLEALSGELARTLEALDGVVSARVHLVLPAAARPGQPNAPSKAAAFLKVRPREGEQLQQQRAEIKALIAGGVEGLSPEAVTLVIAEISTQVPPPPKMPSPAQRLRVLVVALGVAVSVLAVVMVVLTLRLRQLRVREARPRAPPTPAKPLLAAPAAKKAA